MVRRVTRILEATGQMSRPRRLWLAIPIALVAMAAPRVTATQLPAPAIVTPTIAAAGSAGIMPAAQQELKQWSAAEIAASRAQLRLHRFDRAGASLDERWRQALADAGRQGINDFWIVYTLTTTAHGDHVVMSDTGDGNGFVLKEGRFAVAGPPLASVINPSAVNLEGGNLVVLLHFRGPRAEAIDRAGYRSVQLGFDFGRTPVFWLGDASDADSFARVQSLFAAARDRDIQTLFIGLASLHRDANAVIPFLARLVEPSWPAEIRAEAAEGFEHQHDPRSVEILLRVARTDRESDVRSEAAEAIGEVQTAQSIAALHDLISESPDSAVRLEAAEAFSAQPAAQALPAIEKVIATSQDLEVVSEAIEAIGEIDDPASLPLLVQIVGNHPNREAKVEAVETIGDLGDMPGVEDALERIIREQDDAEVQAEAIETLSDIGSSLHPLILELAVSGRSPEIRKEALDAIGGAIKKLSDPQLLDRAQQVIERVVFEDADRGVQEDALDALDEFPSDRALRILRDVIARHPDARIRREAEEHLRERQ